jgi:hypothetical protein
MHLSYAGPTTPFTAIANPRAPYPESGLQGYLRDCESSSVRGGYDRELATSGAVGYDTELANSGEELVPCAAPPVEAASLHQTDLRDDINHVQRDWNAEYQALLETRHDTPEQEVQRIQQLRALYDEFARVATAIGTEL